MKYNNNTASDVIIAYIGGGSRGWAWDLMGDLAGEESLSGTVRLYDIDFDAAGSNEIIGNEVSSRTEAKGKWKYKAEKSIDETLDGADFVIISIMAPGSFKAMESDVHVPEKYGIYQAVGDTVGPGGLMRAMRTLPVYVGFAQKIREHCPKAWVINYTNPMTLCTRILYEVFPDIRAFGCCHEIFSSQILLADILSLTKGIKGVPRDEIRVNVMGINHFTWIDRASYKGIDLIPIYRDFAQKNFEKGYFDARQRIRAAEEQKYFGCYNRVKFDLFLRYGMMAAAGDRHLAEFVPPWYLKNPETAEEWGFALTPMSYRFKKEETRRAKSLKLVKGEEKFPIEKSGEEGVNQIKALCGLGDIVTNVNLPNQGQIEGFPEGAVLETNALFSKNGIQPVCAGKLTDDVKNLVMRHVLNQETIITASMTHDRKLAFNAFVNDPQVNLSLEDSKKLFDEMISNTKDFLPGW